MTLFRLLGAVAFAIAVAAGILSHREKTRMARLETTAAALRQLAATPLAPAGAAPQAGISARAHIDVRPLPDGLAKQLHGDADFHHLVHRCGVCHVTPDPALHTAAEWSAVLERMTAHIETAGLLPLKADVRAAILRVLQANSAPPPTTR